MMNSKQNLVFAKTLFMFSAAWVFVAFLLSFLGEIKFYEYDFILAAFFCAFGKTFVTKERCLKWGQFRYGGYILCGILCGFFLSVFRIQEGIPLLFFLQVTLSSLFTFANTESAGEYEFEKSWIPKIAGLFLLISILSKLLGFVVFTGMERIYVFYLVLSLFTMDFERRHKLQQEQKKGDKIKFFGMLAAVLLVSETVFEKILNPFQWFVHWIWDKFTWFLVHVLGTVLLPILQPFSVFVENVKQWLTQNGRGEILSNLEEQVEKSEKIPLKPQEIPKQFDWTPILNTMKTIIILLLILWIAWKLFTKLKNRKVQKISEREEIFIESLSLKPKEEKKKKRKRPTTKREQIQFYYWELLKKAKQKERYRDFMTVKEFEEASGIVQNKRNLEFLGKIFQQSSFSEGETKENMEEIKRTVKEVERELKRL